MAIGNITDNMLTVGEASKIIHVHPNTLRRWSDKGIIRSYCINHRGDRRFMSQDIYQYLADMNMYNPK